MRHTTKRATIKDVAALAGVTIGTVSHVLNQTAPISAETSRRVHDAMKELDYVPNVMARNMRSKKNHVVGLMIPNLKNNFHARIASSFVELADQKQYVVHILGYEYSLEKEKNELRSLMEYNVGTVVIVNGWNDEEYIKELLDKGIHVILADRHSNLDGVTCVEFENHSALKDAVALLKERNYDSIGFISEPLHLTNLQDRFQAYRKGLIENGYDFCPEHVFISENFCLNSMENGYLYVKKLLKERKREELPQALIASSDLLAIGIQRAIFEAGYRIPEDFGLIGCDNLQISGFVHPGLTTIMQDCDLLDQELWNVIYRQSHGEKVENIILPQKLIVRDSC